MHPTCTRPLFYTSGHSNQDTKTNLSLLDSHPHGSRLSGFTLKAPAEASNRTAKSTLREIEDDLTWSGSSSNPLAVERSKLISILDCECCAFV